MKISVYYQLGSSQTHTFTYKNKPNNVRVYVCVKCFHSDTSFQPNVIIIQPIRNWFELKITNAKRWLFIT